MERLRAGDRLVQSIGPGGQDRRKPYERQAHGPVHGGSVDAARFVR